MRRIASIILTLLLLGGCTDSGSSKTQRQIPGAAVPPRAPTYLGFDRNDYPGDAALDSLRQTFAFSGYWLNAPPGENNSSWHGKRAILRAHGFGFLVLFNGRLDKQLKSPPDAHLLGVRDAALVVKGAKQEGFRPGTIIFLDQEEGGRMLPEQQAYIYAWIDGVNASGYRAGVYCSGIPFLESAALEFTTADNIQRNAHGRKIAFFIYNDLCPPAPGCDLDTEPLLPSQSGVPSATAWQFAQSPRRPGLTALCRYKYNSDGNCYAPLPANQKVHVDLDSATLPDPSHGR